MLKEDVAAADELVISPVANRSAGGVGPRRRRMEASDPCFPKLQGKHQLGKAIQMREDRENEA